jgi:ABC-type glycerol-3-phosphate transport system substrate-binding protein
MIRRALALAALIMILAGCSSAPAPAPPPPVDGADSGGRIVLWTRSQLEVQATLLVDAYNATHTNQVELTLVGDLPARIDGAAATGALPDLLAGGVADVPGWTGRGLYQDLTGRVARLPFAAQLDQSSVRAGTKDGAQHALPFVLSQGQSGDDIGISRDSKKADQAWNFIAWVLSEEAQVQVLARNGDRVARADLQSNEFAATTEKGTSS